jgi:hypothetical protein
MTPRCLLRVVLLLLVAGLVHAAERPAVVVRGGAVVANLHQDRLESEARTGVAVGVGVDLPLSGGFRLMPELWYQQRGFRRGTFVELISLEQRTEVLAIPVLVAYHFEAVSVDPRAFVGLAADVLLGSEIRRDDGDWLDVADDPGSEDLAWSLVLGGGMRWRSLDLDVRYIQGLSAAGNLDYDDFDDVLPQDQAYEDATEATWVFAAGVWF